MKRVVFGAIDTYKSVTKYFMDKYEIAYIVDNDKNKQGTDFYGTMIYPVEKLLEETKDELHILIAVRSAQKDITIQLELLGFEKNKHFFFFYEAYEKNTYFDYLYWRNVKIENGKYMPTLLRLELSGICNARCVYCPYHGFAEIDRGHKTFLSWEVLQKIITQVKEIKSFEAVTVCGHGELFVHKEWYEMLEYIYEETRIKELIIYTNGMLLNKENVEKIAKLQFETIKLEVSIDGWTPEENNAFRKGTDYAVIKNNLKYAFKRLSDKRYKKVITNCYIIQEEMFAMPEEAIDKVSSRMPLPTYLVDDFGKDCAVVTKPTAIIPKIVGGREVFPEAWKEAGISWKYVHTSYGTNCVNLFCVMAFDCSGNMLKCDCGWACLDVYGNIMDGLEAMDEFQNNEKLNQAREQIQNMQCPDFCKYCLESPAGHYVLIRNQEKILNLN